MKKRTYLHLAGDDPAQIFDDLPMAREPWSTLAWELGYPGTGARVVLFSVSLVDSPSYRTYVGRFGVGRLVVDAVFSAGEIAQAAKLMRQACRGAGRSPGLVLLSWPRHRPAPNKRP